MSDPLAAFAAAFSGESAEDAMTRACVRLREATGAGVGPVYVRPILDYLNADMRAVVMPDRDPAVLGVEGGRYVVRFRSADHWRRVRISIAHEVAHMIVLDALRDDQALRKQLRSPSCAEALEHLCWFGARELLMPEADITPRLSANAFTSVGLFRLRERYGVSWDALFRRFGDVSRGVSATLWRPGVRSSDGGGVYRVTASPSYWRASRRTWLPKGISSRSLSLDLISRASSVGFASAPVLYVASHTGGRSRIDVRASAIAVKRSAQSPGQISLDLSGSWTNERLGAHSWDVALFLFPIDEGEECRTPQNSAQLALF